MQGSCSAGKGCSFVHAKDKAAPAPKAKAEAKAKAKPKAEPKAQGKVCYYQGSPRPPLFALSSTITKEVLFSKHAGKLSVRHCKNPTYIKWGIYDKNYVKQWSDAEGRVIFSTKDEIEQYEEYARREALKLFNILNPNNKDPDDFFQDGPRVASREAVRAETPEKEKSKEASGKPTEKPRMFCL